MADLSDLQSTFYDMLGTTIDMITKATSNNIYWSILKFAAIYKFWFGL